jgi:hypothetical protein
MRRSYISPEYDNNVVNGTFNMVEQSTFFGSKMLETESQISIDNNDIIWYQRANNEQIDFSIESSLKSYFYSSSDNKKNNHRLLIDEKQTQFQRERNTRWILEIDLSSILQNYIFASMKKYRTFEGLKNEMTIYNDVDVALNEYIKSNVLNRYRFSKIELFIEYKDLRNNNILRYNNVWNPNVPKNSILDKFQLNQTIPDSLISISFEQRPSSQFAFEYYFNILFEKI